MWIGLTVHHYNTAQFPHSLAAYSPIHPSARRAAAAIRIYASQVARDTGGGQRIVTRPVTRTAWRTTSRDPRDLELRTGVARSPCLVALK